MEAVAAFSSLWFGLSLPVKGGVDAELVLLIGDLLKIFGSIVNAVNTRIFLN